MNSRQGRGFFRKEEENRGRELWRNDQYSFNNNDLSKRNHFQQEFGQSGSIRHQYYSNMESNDSNQFRMDQIARSRENMSRGRYSPVSRDDIVRQEDFRRSHSTLSIYEDRSHPVEEILSQPNRVQSLHRNKIMKTPNQEFAIKHEARTGGRSVLPAKDEMLNYHADLIVNKMKKDRDLMESTPASEKLRRDALRDMPQCLTLKRCVKEKLSTIGEVPPAKTISCFTLLKYKLSIFFSKLSTDLKNFMYTFELWYYSLKEIEGNFGSGVATFFRFFRWIFILNCFIAIVSISFIVLPQLTHKSTYSYSNFHFKDIFNGEGYLQNSVLFYGFYSNGSVGAIQGVPYQMPAAYFFTMLCIYLISLLILSISAAEDFKKSYIETEVGLKNIFSQKIFCSWDYSIATENAANLKSKSLYNEIRELLSELKSSRRDLPVSARVSIAVTQITSHIFVVLVLIGTGFLVHELVKNSSTFEDYNIVNAISINAIMLVFPLIFTFVVKLEDYKKPKLAVYLTLIRTFLLGFVVIAVLIVFWLNKAAEGWETSLAQEMYRLIVFDFLISVPVTTILEISVYFIKKHTAYLENYLEFDVARYTMQVIYNQALLWFGLFFSPLLPVVVVIKLFITWYVRKYTLLKLCKPPAKQWRGAHMKTWFEGMALVSCLLVSALLAYIITNIRTSNESGPFRDHNFIFHYFTKDMLKIESASAFWKFLLMFTKPGFIGIILIGLGTFVYFLRHKALSQKELIEIYREMTLLQAEDKKYLLDAISKYSKDDALSHQFRELDPVITSPNSNRKTARFEGEQEIGRGSAAMYDDNFTSGRGAETMQFQAEVHHQPQYFY